MSESSISSAWEPMGKELTPDQHEHRALLMAAESDDVFDIVTVERVTIRCRGVRIRDVGPSGVTVEAEDGDDWTFGWRSLVGVRRHREGDGS